MKKILSAYRGKKGSDLELKPCPFCGSDEIIYIKYQSNSGPRWGVFCRGCAAGIDPGWVQNKYTLTPMWNSRVELPADK